MAGGYPCCCVGEGSSSSPSPCHCSCCLPLSTPCSVTLTLCGLLNASCTDCDTLNGTYVLDWLDPLTTNIDDWCGSLLLLGAGSGLNIAATHYAIQSGCAWGLEMPAVCGCYTKAIYGYVCNFGGMHTFFALLPDPCVSSADPEIGCGAGVLVWSKYDLLVAGHCYECKTLTAQAGDFGKCEVPVDSVVFAECGDVACDSTSCCGADMPGTLHANLTGADDCTCPAPWIGVANDFDLTFFGTGEFARCLPNGATLFAGNMKWYYPQRNGGSLVLVADCLADKIALTFYATCCADPNWFASWYGEAPLGSCHFNNVQLHQVSSSNGCGAGSILTLTS